jgi:hypothetical protein
VTKPTSVVAFLVSPATPLILIAALAQTPINHQAILLWHNVHMSDQCILTLRQADQARTDFALLESNLQFIMGQLARLPTRGDLAMAALGIIISTAALVILWAEAFWRL